MGRPQVHTRGSRARPRVDVACDESGFVGGSLFGAMRVFAHASVSLGAEEARELLGEVRRRTAAGPGELKASLLRQAGAQPVVAWLCGPEGRLGGRAVVHVTDTRLFGLARLVQLVESDRQPDGWWSATELPTAWDQACRLDRLLTALPRPDEQAFLEAARDLLWVNRRVRPRAPDRTWIDLVRAVAARLDDAERPVVAGLVSPEAVERIGRYLAGPPRTPLTEPLLPALRWTVVHWSALGDPDVVHDEQSVLTPSRVAALAANLAARHPGRRLAGFTRVDSRDDARVQVADLVAGVVRRAVAGRLARPAAAPEVPIEHLVAEGSPLAGRLRTG